MKNFKRLIYLLIILLLGTIRMNHLHEELQSLSIEIFHLAAIVSSSRGNDE